MKKTKDFDCVEMKSKIQEDIYKRIKDLTLEEEIEYWNHRAETGPMADFYKSLKGKK